MLKVSFPAGTSTYYTSTAGRPASAYYTDEATLCEPPGVWWGPGAASLGLSGVVDADLAEAIFDRLLDPRDELVADRAMWEQAATLGRAAGRYRAAEHIEAQMLAAEPDASPERREVIRVEAGMKARTARTFIDATFSPVKSVSLLHIAAVREAALARAGGDEQAALVWQWVRDEIEEAVRVANAAGLGYLSDHGGYTRSGHHGGAGGRWVDAHDLTVGTFFQYSTRAGDPGLHCHNLVLNRALDASGQWRALDATCLIAAQQGAGSVADRVLEVELGRRLGVDFELLASGVSREIVGTTETMIEAVSTRSADIAKVARPILEAYEERVNRPATALERRKILDQVAARTRGRKDAEQVESPQQRAERVETQISAQVGMSLSMMARTLLESARTGTPVAGEFSPDSIIKEAVAQVALGQAVWSRHQLTRHILALLPPLGDLTPQQVRQVADSLTDQALRMPTHGEHQGAVLGATSEYGVVSVSGSLRAYVPTTDRLADGRSAFHRPGAERFAVAGSIVAERALRAAATVQAGQAMAPAGVKAWLEQRRGSGLVLGADQQEAVTGILTGRQQLSILIGPAGTGKSRVAAVLAEAWADPTLWDQQPAGWMIGLAISQNAANILTQQGMTALNVHRWLLAQRRLAAGTALPEDRRYQLTAADLVLVDEASMLDTPAADEIRCRVQAAGARWVWAGDHRQLGAVGAGGMMCDLAYTARTFELTEVRRMRETWERAASLRLRDGDLSVLAEYERHGRLRACGTLAHAEADAVRGWLADTLDHTASTIIVGTNEQAARLSTQCRNELVTYGRVSPDGVHLPRQSTLAGTGDLIITRTNNRTLTDTDGQRVEVWNRDRWHVLDTAGDGALTVRSADRPDDPRRIVLPADYVTASVELGYTTTEHGVEGQTIRRAHVVRPPGGTLQGLYVDLSRTTEHTIVYVPTVADPTVADGQVHKVPDRTATSVLAESLERDGASPAAATASDEDQAYHRSARTIVERYTAIADQAGAARLTDTLTLLAATDEIPDTIPALVAADESRTQLGWLLRRVELAGHDPDQVLKDAVGRGSLAGARSVAQVLHGRISTTYTDQLTPTPTSAVDRVPAVGGEHQHALTDLAALLDDRRRTLGAETTRTQPDWATRTLGPTPTDPMDRLDWQDRAGRIALHREVADHTDPTQPISRCPAPGLVEQVAIWHDAWGALGRPELARAEAEMTDGRLLTRVRAGTLAETQAPTYLGEHLRTAAVTALDRAQDATFLNARATLTDDPDQQADLHTEATQARMAAALADHDRTRLTEIDDARRQWLDANALTLAHAEAARAELRERGLDPGHEPDQVTATDWLTAEDTARREDDLHRPITETDLTNHPDDIDANANVVDGDMEVVNGPGATGPTLAPVDDLDAEVNRARSALAELADRRSAEAAHHTQEAAEQAEREIAWHRTDQARAVQYADADVR